MHRLQRSRQSRKNSNFHVSSSERTCILNWDACLLARFLSLFHHDEATTRLRWWQQTSLDKRHSSVSVLWSMCETRVLEGSRMKIGQKSDRTTSTLFRRIWMNNFVNVYNLNLSLSLKWLAEQETKLLG